MTKLNRIQDALESFDRAVFLQRGLCFKKNSSGSKSPTRSDRSSGNADPTGKEDGLFLATMQLHLGKMQEKQGNYINVS